MHPRTIGLLTTLATIAALHTACGGGGNDAGTTSGGTTMSVTSSTATGAGGDAASATTTTGAGGDATSSSTGSASGDEAIEQAIAKAAEGLLYTSESDYPFELVTGSSSPGSPVLEATIRKDFAAYVEAKAGADKPLASLFAMQRSWSEWKASPNHCSDPNDPAEVEQCQKMKGLNATLEAELGELTVFYFGSVGAPGAVDGTGVSIFLVGRTPSGKLVGVATLAIWT